MDFLIEVHFLKAVTALAAQRTDTTSYGVKPGKEKTMDNKRKPAIYCRTAYANDGNIAEQEAQLCAYADEHGYADAVCYRNSGAAGDTFDRFAIAALTAEIKAGEIGAVLVTDISQIARTFQLISEWRKLLREHGLKVIALADGGTVSTAELTYRLVGDYFLPNIALSEPSDAPPLGCYGMLHKAYLWKEKPALYAQPLLSERLYPLCRELTRRRILGLPLSVMPKSPERSYSQN
jgi:hypothetical protein